MKASVRSMTCLGLALLTLSLLAVGCTQSVETSPALTSDLSAQTTSAPPTAQNQLFVNMPSFADLLSSAEIGVVQVNISATAQVGRHTVEQQGAGSGWVLDADGTIVTNNHVVEGANTISVVTADGTSYPAEVINTDPTADIALIKISGAQLTSMKVGDASKCRRGDWVLAMGNPLGEGITATEGIISRLSVSVPLSSTQIYNDLIETTAAINPGNSGGPLINMSGEVIGMATLGGTGVEGMGYAISMVDALPIIQALLK